MTQWGLENLFRLNVLCLLQVVGLVIDFFMTYCVFVLKFNWIPLMRSQKAVYAIKLRWLSTPYVICSINEVLSLKLSIYLQLVGFAALNWANCMKPVA